MKITASNTQLIQPKVSTCIDAKTWIQKILLEEKYGKINS